MNKNERYDLPTSESNQDGEAEKHPIKTVSFETPSEEVLRSLKEDLMVFVDLNLTQKEKETLQTLEVEKNTEDFHYWGSPNSEELLAVLNTFLRSAGDNSEDTVKGVSDLFVRIAEGLTRICNVEAVWIESRAILPNNFFETPRWHTDAKFFNPVTAHKLVVAIKGPQTRFGRTTDQERFIQLSIDENKEKHGSEEDIRIRKELDLIVEEVHAPGKDNAAVYLVSGDDAVVHSEPPINESRLFISMIPGSKEEIEEWRNRMEQKRLRKQQKQ